MLDTLARVDPDAVVDEAALTSGGGSSHSYSSNDNLGPEGRHKVKMYLNDQLDRTLKFEVR
jgi:hypothetical protein